MQAPSFLKNLFANPSVANKQTSSNARDTDGTKKPRPQRNNEFADELKQALVSVGKNKGGQIIGVQLGDRAVLQRQVDDLVKEIKTSYSSYSSEIGKAKKIKDFNKTLVTNFRKNLQVMVDVTKLLTSYVQLFDVLKSELVKINTLVGKDANLDDISYLEQITQKQISTLQSEFMKQTETLESLYGKYDLGAERANITETKEQMTDIIRSATDMYTQRGGRRRRSNKAQFT